MAVTILITGFGPFPGARFNPTGPLVKQLARLQRHRLANVTIVPHVFETGYAAVDRDLPKLIAQHKPDALLMFGLATRAKTLRIETRARNALALTPDARGATLCRGAIAEGSAASMVMPAPARRLLEAVRMARVPATLSRDAGSYLCNYLCWRAAEASVTAGSPRYAAFVHVPSVRHGARPRRAYKPKLAFDDLLRSGNRLVTAMAAAARR